MGNLKNIGDRDDKKEIQSKGGKASGAARRKKKELRERIQALLDRAATSPDAVQALQDIGMDGGDYLDAMTAAILLKALKGDCNAVKLVAELSGESAAEKRAEAAEVRADNKDDRERRLLEMKETQFNKTGLLDGACVPPTVITVHKDGSVDVRGGLENLPILIDNMEFMN